MPSKANLELYQGDDYAAVVTVSKLDGDLDLTGFAAQAQIRVGPADKNAQVIADIDTTVAPPDKINLAIRNSVTLQIPGGYYVWDLQVTDPGGVVTTILAGNVVVARDVTRAANGARK